MAVKQDIMLAARWLLLFDATRTEGGAMRAISVVLVFLHLSGCAGMPSSRDTGPSGTQPSACASSGGVTVRSESFLGFQSFQADSGLAAAIGALWMLLGLVGTLADCPRTAAATDASSG